MTAIERKLAGAPYDEAGQENGPEPSQALVAAHMMKQERLEKHGRGGRPGEKAERQQNQGHQDGDPQQSAKLAAAAVRPAGLSRCLHRSAHQRPGRNVARRP